MYKDVIWVTSTIKSKEFTGVDPENANYGYPIPMNITFGINVGF